MQANTIHEVIQYLDQIIEESKRNNNSAGYFAALYRKVTQRVQVGIAHNEFDDGSRMERFDVLFANRYLAAYDQYYNGGVPTESWRVAFEHTRDYWPITLQHLLWGMNAHINLDLGIAAAETVQEAGQPIGVLKDDFNRINILLASLVGEVEAELSDIWPLLKWILTWSKDIDDFLVNFSMARARDGAWKFANELYTAPPMQHPAMIAARDATIGKLADLINPPGLLPKLVFRFARIGERGTVAEKIAVLE